MHSAPEKFGEEGYNMKKKKVRAKLTLNIFYTYSKKAIGTWLFFNRKPHDNIQSGVKNVW